MLQKAASTIAEGETVTKVFIADDSKIFRERLKEMLSELTKVEIIGEAE